MRLGCKVTAVHGALGVNESAFMRPYVEMCTAKKAEAKRGFGKLACNACFGKFCEQVKNRVDVRLVNDRKKALKLIAKPTFKQRTIYNEHLVGIHMRLAKVKLDKPSYVGVAILDISKILMYRFWYDFCKPLWGDNVKLLFSDTDENVYTRSHRGRV